MSKKSIPLKDTKTLWGRSVINVFSVRQISSKKKRREYPSGEYH